MKKAELDVYDPRQREDFRFELHGTEEAFSSLRHNFFVVNGVDVDWSSYADALDDCIRRAAPNGFVTFTPWRPGSEQAYESFLGEFDDAHRMGASLLGFFAHHNTSIAQVLHFRKRVGGDRSGEWCIGSCFKHDPGATQRSALFKPPKEAGFGVVVEQPDAIECALALDEMRQSTFVCRVTLRTSSAIDALRARLLGRRSSAESRRNGRN